MSLARFGVEKPVPINLLMWALIVGGIVAGLSLRREFFPETEPDAATVQIVYPGASPEEIETSVVLKLEDKIAELDEVDKITTTVAEGGGGILVQFREGLRDVPKAVREVERAVESLTDLPADLERLTVVEVEPELPVIRLTLFGEVDEEVLKRAVRTVRDELKALPGMGEVRVEGLRDYELSVEVRSGALLEHGLSLPEVSDTIGRWMAEVPGGTVRTETGNVKVRTMGVAEHAEAVRQIVLRGSTRGQALRVGDVAVVRETFVDDDIRQRYNGQPSASLVVFKVGDQDIIRMAEMVHAYAEGRRGQAHAPKHRFENWMKPHMMRAWDRGAHSPTPLPPGVAVSVNTDLSRYVEGRLDLLTRNAMQGAVLVMATLILFLNWRAAMWVGTGMFTALMGTLLLMYWMDLSLNFLTMFGLIIVVGILVDDGIVVAENIQTMHDQGEPAASSAIRGAGQVLWPVTATVMTNIVAFLPLTFIRGRIGDLMGALPMVVTCAMLMSLVESLVILPSHMAHSLLARDRLRALGRRSPMRRFEDWRDRMINDRVIPGYARLLGVSLRYRYISLSAALGLLILSMGLVAGGRVQYTFLSRNDAETIVVDLRMPIGTTLARTQEAVSLIEQAARAQPETRNISSSIGLTGDMDSGAVSGSPPHRAQMFVELAPTEERDRQSAVIIAAIRSALRGVLPQVDRLTFSELSGGPGGADITFQVRGEDLRQTEAVADALKAMLGRYPGVFDIADDFELGQTELQIALKPGAAAMGLSTAEVARQVRGTLYGLDAHVFSAEREDIDVRVRLDEATRRSVPAIENLWMINAAGHATPMREVADIREGLTYSTIRRIDRQRTITVSAATAPGLSPEDVVRQLPIEHLRSQYPYVTLEMGGRQEQQMDAFASLPLGFAAAAVMIYVILAWLFGSYAQPLIVMLTIPFSLVGAILGHFVMGFDITFLSVIGFVALSGVVVNDSLVFMEFYNHLRQSGTPVRPALIDAGRQRLRAIVLTTLTTVLGLTPLLAERSFQATFLIPMAITIAFGLMSSTVLVLMVLPCVLQVGDDLRRAGYFLWHGRALPEPSTLATAAEDLAPPHG